MAITAHPLAMLFPMLPEADGLALRADLKANGQRQKIILLDGMVLDGRNRQEQLEALGLVDGEVPPDGSDLWISRYRRFVPAQDGDPLAFVLSLNLHRRHLNDGQRAMVAAAIANMGQGARTDLAKDSDEPSANLPKVSQADAAEMLHVSTRSVTAAAKVREQGAPELVDRVKAGQVSVSAAADLADLPVGEQLGILQNRDPKAFRQALRGLRVNRSGDNRVVMNSRVQAPDDLDYSPTPPWATRAMLQIVLPHLGQSLAGMTVLEPACGEGHISAVLEEAGPLAVWASDIWDYSVDGVSPSGWVGTRDYLAEDEVSDGIDWVITNSPFGTKAEAFAHKALRDAQVGVAMFVRLGWLASNGRYERLYSVNPPTLIAIFAEDVPLHMGRWEPDGQTMSDYVWLVWVKGMAPQPPFWIPPGQRLALTLADDVERFTAHPVRSRQHLTAESHAKASEDDGTTEPETNDATADSVTGEAIRPDAGRSASATSERMDATGGESAATTSNAAVDQFAHDIFVGGMRDNAVATFQVDKREGGYFPSLSYMLLGAAVSGGFRANEGARTAKLAAGAAMSELLRRFGQVIAREDRNILDRHRAALRAGMAWLRLRAQQWGVALDPDVALAEVVHAESEAIAISKAAALDIIKARYTGDNGQQLADELGRPLNTIRKWAWEAGVSNQARSVERGMANLAKINSSRETIS